MQAILWDKLPIAEIVNVKAISLEQAPQGYKSFDAGVASKFVIKSAWAACQGGIKPRSRCHARHDNRVLAAITIYLQAEIESGATSLWKRRRSVLAIPNGSYSAGAAQPCPVCLPSFPPGRAW